MATFESGVRIGEVLKGKYQILQKIGEGGFSYVYLAIDLELMNKQWAIKEVVRSGKDAAGRNVEATLEREAEILSRLDHPNIVAIHDVFKTDEFIYVVMDHVEGESLAKVLRREGAQSAADVQAWMLQLCDALSYLHNQEPPIIFRDIKPGNIMLRPDGYVKLIDFGVVREYKEGKSADTVAFGTVGFAAPEARENKMQTDARSDIFSMGATMWNLLTGVLPSTDTASATGIALENAKAYNPNIPDGFADIIIPKCVKTNRAERYQTCEELAADLEIYQQLSKDYRNQQLKKVKLFAGFGIAAIALLFVGLGTHVAQDVMVNNQFNNLVAQAEAQSSSELAQSRYLDAIAKKPGVDGKEAYEGLIALYKEDGVFTGEEKETFTRLYENNLSNANVNSAEAAELFFDIGELYWAYSDGSNSELTRIKSAEGFFKKAQAYDGADFDLREEAQAYYALVEYAANVQNFGNEANADIDFAQEWQYFSNLVSNGSLDPVVQMRNYKLIASQIIRCHSFFKEAGVTSLQASELLKSIDDNMAQFDEVSKHSALYSDTVSELAKARSYISKWSLNEGTVS